MEASIALLLQACAIWLQQFLRQVDAELAVPVEVGLRSRAYLSLLVLTVDVYSKTCERKGTCAMKIFNASTDY